MARTTRLLPEARCSLLPCVRGCSRFGCECPKTLCRVWLSLSTDWDRVFRPRFTWCIKPPWPLTEHPGSRLLLRVRGRFPFSVRAPVCLAAPRIVSYDGGFQPPRRKHHVWMGEFVAGSLPWALDCPARTQRRFKRFISAVRFCSGSRVHVPRHYRHSSRDRSCYTLDPVSRFCPFC